MVFLVFGTYRRTAVHPQNETYPHITCQSPQCPGRVHLMVNERYCHICFIPIPVPIMSQDVVKCCLCGLTLARDLHEFQLKQHAAQQDEAAALVAQKVEMVPTAATPSTTPAPTTTTTTTTTTSSSPTVVAIPAKVVEVATEQDEGTLQEKAIV